MHYLNTTKPPQRGLVPAVLFFQRQRRKCKSLFLANSLRHFPLFRLQVAVEGRKQGITKKALGTKKARVFISKVELFGYFLNVAKENNFEVVKGEEVLNYLDAKMKAVEYQEVWKSVKCNYFKVWTKKDENMLRFRYNT